MGLTRSIYSGEVSMNSFNNIYEKLLDYADNMRIIDTHEHLPPHKNHCGDKPDVLCDYFSHYITSDLQAAGMSAQELDKIIDVETDLQERFRLLEPWLDKVKNTSYYRSLEISAARIHGVKEISAGTIAELNDKFVKAASQENYRKYIMQDVCKIEVSLNDNWEDDMVRSATELFAPVWQPVNYLNYTDSGQQSNDLTADRSSLDEYCEKYKRHFQKQVSDGAKALKFPVAYWRSLYFEDVCYSEAKKLFNDAVRLKIPFPKKLQDFMMHFILRTAEEISFPVQIHTGIQEGMGHDLEDSNPLLLKNLFGKYPDLTFDLFHTGYPYERELAVLAKYYKNVYVDFCWSHLISPFAARNAFYEMLDVLPYTKIFGFGGDYVFYDGVVGHLTLAKQNICTVLAQKVVNDECDTGFAECILQAVLYDNAKAVFKL